MTEFADPLKMIRSVYSHINAESHEINLADDSKCRWVGFSCVGCNDEYITWQCPVKVLRDPVSHNYSGDDRVLLGLVRTQEGRISIRDAVNRFVTNKRAIQKFSQIKSSNHNPLLEDPNAEIKMLEGLFMDESARRTTADDSTIIEMLRISFLSNIPNRYNRKPVI